MKHHSPSHRPLPLLLCTLFLPITSCQKKPTQPAVIVQTTPGFSTAPSKSPDSIDLTKIDIDMTKMSATMIYAEVFNMLIMPEEYIGKLIKVSGLFQVFEDDTDNQRYFAILIPDATKCCQQGIEFVYAGEHTYPQDYPEIGQEITITGTYNCIDNEDGISYAYLDVYEIEAN